MKMAVFWAMMMEAVQTSETLVNSYQYTLRYNPEDSHLQGLSCIAVQREKKESHTAVITFCI
jgi:hypothetical protein